MYLGDCWYTSAFELNYRGYIVGTTLNTNYGAKASSDVDYEAESPLLGENRGEYGAWNNGKVFRAPLYFGFQSGNQVSRIGYSHKYVQDYTQNLVHQRVPFGRQHFYIHYQPNTNGPYFYRGYYNPYSLYFK